MKLIMRFVKESQGQDLIEYALLASVISIGVIAAMGVVKDALNTEFTSISTSVTSAS